MLILPHQSRYLIFLCMLRKNRNFPFTFLLIGLIFSLRGVVANTPGIKFIENKNQWSSDIHFSARIPGGMMVVKPGVFRYIFVDEQRMEQLHQHAHGPRESSTTPLENEKIDGHVVDVNFIGARSNLLPLSFGKSLEYYNYFLGEDVKNWASKAYAYEGFVYPSLYNGIDLKVYSINKHVKYDLTVAPMTDPSQIRLAYDGAENLTLIDGRLRVVTSVGEVMEQEPVAYQWIDGKKVWIACQYNLEGNQLSFCFPEGFDPCYELTIDPLLIFSTYSGSTADNWGSTATPGENGMLY